MITRLLLKNKESESMAASRRRLGIVVSFLITILVFGSEIPAFAAGKVSSSKYKAEMSLSYSSGGDRTDAGFAIAIIKTGLIFTKDHPVVCGWIDAFSQNELRYATAYWFHYTKAGICSGAWQYSNMGVWDSYYSAMDPGSVFGTKCSKVKVTGGITDYPYSIWLKKGSLEYSK